MDKVKLSNAYIIIAVILLTFFFVILSTITKNSMWLIPSIIVLIVYLIYFIRRWYDIRARQKEFNERKIFKAEIDLPKGYVKIGPLDILTVSLSLILILAFIAALSKGNDPGELYIETLHTVETIFGNLTITLSN